MADVNFQYGIFRFESDAEREFNELRTIKTEDGEILFCATDAAKMIGYANTRDAINRHCKHVVKHDIPCKSGSYTDNEGNIIDIIKVTSLSFIPESDLYRLTFKSQLPKAEDFIDWIAEDVLPSIRKKGYYGEIDRKSPSNFILRYDLNFERLDTGYFSVISELYTRLFVKFHVLGYDIPDKTFDNTEIRPDTSIGRRFPAYLHLHHPELENEYKMYKHTFPNYNNKTVDARQYKNCVLPAFIEYLDNEWIPKVAYDYFNKRDKKALEYLPKLIASSKPKEEPPNDDFDKGIDKILGFEIGED